VFRRQDVLVPVSLLLPVVWRSVRRCCVHFRRVRLVLRVVVLAAFE
jgi:hypothetical protein